MGCSWLLLSGVFSTVQVLRDKREYVRDLSPYSPTGLDCKDIFCGRIEKDHPVPVIYGDNAGYDTSYNPLIESLQGVDIVLFSLEFNSAFSCLFRKKTAKESDEEKGPTINNYIEQDIKALAFCRVECQRRAEGLDYIVVVQTKQEAIEYTAAGSYDQTALAIEEDASADDGKEIEEREYAFRTSCGIDNGCGENRIQKKLDIGQFDEVFLKSKKNNIDKSREIDGGDKEVMECLNIPEIGLCLLYLDQDGCTQEKRDEEHPQKHQFLKAIRQFKL